MPILTVPDSEAVIIDRFDLDTPAQVNRSAWTKRRKVIDLPGAQMWSFQFHIEGVNTELAERPWRSFLVRLGGPANPFRLPVACSQHTGPKPRTQENSSGSTLRLSGFAGAQSMYAGQYLTVPLPSGHERLVMIINDFIADGGGNAIATVLPPLDEVPVSGLTVESINPWALVALPDSRNGWSLSDGISDFQFTAEEAL